MAKFRFSAVGSLFLDRLLGRLEDSNVAKDWDGHNVLDIDNWTIKKNDDWINKGIDKKQDYYIASPTKDNLWDNVNNRETVFARELRMLEDAGYVRRGDYYIHPDNL